MKVLETKLFWKDVKKLPDNMTKKLVVLHEQFKSAVIYKILNALN